MKTLLITGTDTDVGKTWVSSLLLRNLTQLELRVGAYKPVCSGATISPDGSSSWHDVDMLAESCGWLGDRQMICPQTFQAAVAPNIAAEMEGRTVDDELLIGGAEAWQSSVDYLLVEGAGGLLCPLSNSSTVADFAIRLAAPIVIVAANRLGMINHTLLTVAVARQRELRIAAIIVNDTLGTAKDVSRTSNQRQLQHWLPDVCILSCRHSATYIENSNGAKIAVRELFGDGSDANTAPANFPI